jgi:type I restriction enzyme, S subunit
MELKPEYDISSVGVIPKDWKLIKIGSVSKLVNGRGFKPFEWKTQGLPIIRIQNLNGSDEFNYFQGPYDPKLEIEFGQLLFAWSGSRGTSFGPHIWRGIRGLLNYHTWKVEVDEAEIDKGFYFYALKWLTSHIEDEAHGASALVHVQKWQVELLEFPSPSHLREQRAVAMALSDMDGLLEGLEQLIAKKRDLKQAAMQQLLTGQTRLPGFTGEWQVTQIGNIAPLQRGYDLPTPQITPGPYPVVYSNGILNHHEAYKVKGPGVVTGRSGTIGKVTFVESNYWPHNTSLWVTSFMGNSPKFVFYLYTRLNFERFASGSGVPTLNRNDIHASTAFMPPTREEQDVIAEVLTDMDAEISALAERLSKTRDLRQAMMQELLTGKTRLVATDDVSKEVVNA